MYLRLYITVHSSKALDSSVHVSAGGRDLGAGHASLPSASQVPVPLSSTVSLSRSAPLAPEGLANLIN